MRVCFVQHTTLTLTWPRQGVRRARSDQSAGHAKPLGVHNISYYNGIAFPILAKKGIFKTNISSVNLPGLCHKEGGGSWVNLAFLETSSSVAGLLVPVGGCT